MKPLLEVKNIKKVFYKSGHKEFTAVDGISFQIYPGEILGIVGESGSGKSTVARMITRLTDATSGQILFEDIDITHIKGNALCKIYRELQMIFQHPMDSFNPRCTLGSSIGESLRNIGLSREETRKKVISLLSQCELPAEFARRYPHEVSGGQCQRAAIARGLAIGPKLLICDEATSALDVTVQKQIIDLLRSLQNEHGMSYLFICHNLALVQIFCDRVLVMHEGKIVEEGIPDDVIMHPKSDYTKRLIEAAI